MAAILIVQKKFHCGIHFGTLQNNPHGVHARFHALFQPVQNCQKMGFFNQTRPIK